MKYALNALKWIINQKHENHKKSARTDWLTHMTISRAATAANRRENKDQSYSITWEHFLKLIVHEQTDTTIYTAAFAAKNSMKL